jgi:hypothetical protein
MDEVEVIQLQPRTYSKFAVLAIGLDFASDVCMLAANSLQALTVMTVQHDIQTDINKRFKEITGGS